MRGKAILSFSSGIAAIIATLIGVALLNPPRTADAAVIPGALVPCPLAEVAIDSGYGVSSKALRPVCSTAQASSSAR